MADEAQTQAFIESILEIGDVTVIRSALERISEAVSPFTQSFYKWGFVVNDLTSCIVDVKSVMDAARRYETAIGNGEDASTIVSGCMGVLSSALNYVPGMTYPSLVMGIGQKSIRTRNFDDYRLL